MADEREQTDTPGEAHRERSRRQRPQQQATDPSADAQATASSAPPADDANAPTQDAAGEQSTALGKATDVAAQDETPPSTDPRVPRDDLIANARSLFGVGRHVMVGALHGRDGDAFTHEQAREALDEFMGREVG